MRRYTFYIPGCNQLTGLSQEDWDFLVELAEENNTPPGTFAGQILSAELARYRDEIAYAEEVRQEIDTLINRTN